MNSKFHLIDVFSHRPSLPVEASRALKTELEKQFPELKIDPDLATVTELAQTSGTTLTAALQVSFLTGKTFQWRAEQHRLIADPAATPPLELAVDMAQLAILIDSVSLSLPDVFIQAITCFWDREFEGGKSPGRQLIDAFEQRNLKLRRPEMSDAYWRERCEQKALHVLDAQLMAIERVSSLAFQDYEEMERYLAKVTDIAPLLDDEPSIGAATVTRMDQLPQWLASASSADRLDYSRRLSALAVVADNAAGEAWNDDLPPILEFARREMQDGMLKDHPEATGLTLDDVTVHVAKVVAAAVSSAGQMVAVGGVQETQRMSVAAFALGNLSSLPNATITLSMRDGGPLPAWLTVDYLKALMVRADVGDAYPKRVERYLVTDVAQAARRKILFTDQLRVQLPLKALEQKIRGQGQLTQAGVRLIDALVDKNSSTKNVVLRPLAWVAHAGAKADEVCNMFVVGAADTSEGPVVLYRPFVAEPLTEYSTWSALRKAIVDEGTLQEQVLVWMTEQGRERYANGGFEQPHIARFGQGSDFAPIPTPAPAQLSVSPVPGDVMSALFNANAQALIDLADRESISNAESRWAMIQQGGWLALEAVMPFLSGAVGTALWLVQLMTGVERVLAAGEQGSSAAKSEAWSSLLLTLAMILLHQGFKPGIAVATSEVGGLKPADGSDPVLGDDTSVKPVSTESTPLLDFSWTNLGHRLTGDQVLQLERMKVEETSAFEGPSSMSGREGLYLHDNRWHVRLDSGMYEVVFVQGDIHILDPQNVRVPGPRIRHDRLGWALDLSLRLKGGGPTRNARQMALENAARLKQVMARDVELGRQRAALYKKFEGWELTTRNVDRQLPGPLYDLIETDLNALKALFAERKQLQQTLRPADRLGEKVTATDLQGIGRRIAFLEALLLTNSVKLARDALVALRSDGGYVTVTNVDAYLALFSELVKLQDRAVTWSQVREDVWVELRDVPKVGESYWREEALELQQNNLVSHLAWRVDRMWSLLELCFTRDVILSGEGDHQFRRLRVDDPLHAAFSSHVELEKPNDYSVQEQIEVLESSLREYERCSLVANHARDGGADTLDAHFMDRFMAELSAITERAEKRLSDLVRESTESVPRRTEYVPRVKQTRKRVIKTRNHRTLVGRVRDGETDFPGVVVDVTKATSDTVVGTYHLHENGEWVEVETVRPPKPERPKSVVTLDELKRRASTVLARVDTDINEARRLSLKTYEPADIENILVLQGDRLNELADKFAAHVSGLTEDQLKTDPASLEAGKLRAAAARLVAEGRKLRINMIKAQSPTATRLSYLASEQQVDIARYEGRKNMSGSKRNDFLQEYVIRNKDQTVLWWAHFHYANEDAPNAAFTAAHLKLPSQRLMGYSAQVKAARDNKDVVSIYRSYIGKDVAQRLFLDLVVEPKKN
ncbi:dermonecrotic toxin domain-containing protein [Pseudomonas sp. NPDC088444]|uniref:dermonecrotic toxin domain-containing protein n=1 Tax=Pseudomonas sp. NPDC088444 TaxID=3364456 RepID=UPI0038506C20